MSMPLSPDAVDLLRNFDPEKLSQEVISLGEEWADADAAASVLEETKKSELSRLIILNMETKLGVGGKQLSVAQAENMALSDDHYTAHLQRMIEQRRLANRLRVRYDMGRMKLELYRSLQATLRNEMSLSKAGR
jgi:hypothetical protein